MSSQDLTIDLETLRRFDRPGPRYTSYPTAVEFHEGIGAVAYQDCLTAANERGADLRLSLYTHLPFCIERCRFCACNVVITPHYQVAEKYLGYLTRDVPIVITEHGGFEWFRWAPPHKIQKNTIDPLLAKLAEYLGNNS